MSQASIPVCEPVELRAGDSWNWNRTVTDYSAADGWTLTYSIIGPSVLHLDSNSITADGAGWQVRVVRTRTEPLQPGRYDWYAFVSDADERYEIGRGSLSVTQNVAAMGDGRKSFARRQLEVVEAAMEGRLTADIESYAINGRAVSKIPYAQLRGEYVRLSWEVWGEDNPGVAYPDIEVAFGPA